jgi:hypothetical protein
MERRSKKVRLHGETPDSKKVRLRGEMQGYGVYAVRVTPSLGTSNWKMSSAVM